MAVLTILRTTGPSTNRYGDRLAATEAAHELPGCVVAPRGSSESNSNFADMVIVGLTVYAPSEAVQALPEGKVKPDDRAKYKGETYEVEGEPQEWENPFSGESHGWQFALTRTEG